MNNLTRSVSFSIYGYHFTEDSNHSKYHRSCRSPIPLDFLAVQYKTPLNFLQANVHSAGLPQWSITQHSYSKLFFHLRHSNIPVYTSAYVRWWTIDYSTFSNRHYSLSQILSTQIDYSVYCHSLARYFVHFSEINFDIHHLKMLIWITFQFILIFYTGISRHLALAILYCIAMYCHALYCLALLWSLDKNII